MSYTRRNEPYNELSERIEAIEALGCYGHRWTHKGADLNDNLQKLFCRTADGREYEIRTEYLDGETALLSVGEEFIEIAYEAILTEFPFAGIVGQENFIRISSSDGQIAKLYGPQPIFR